MIVPPCLGVVLISVFLFNLFDVTPKPQTAVLLMFSRINPLILFILAIEIVVLAPVFEELFFRRCLFSVVRKKFSFGFSAIVSGIFFSFLHYNTAVFVPIFFLGVVFAYVYERTQNLLAPILLHAAHNSAVLILILLIKVHSG